MSESRVYPSTNEWIFWDGRSKHFYATEGEAKTAMAKIDTAKAVVSAVQSLTPATDMAIDVVEDFFENGPFDDVELEALGIIAVQLTACVTLLQNFELFMAEYDEETPIVNAKYRATLNQVRHV